MKPKKQEPKFNLTRNSFALKLDHNRIYYNNGHIYLADGGIAEPMFNGCDYFTGIIINSIHTINADDISCVSMQGLLYLFKNGDVVAKLECEVTE